MDVKHSPLPVQIEVGSTHLTKLGQAMSGIIKLQQVPPLGLQVPLDVHPPAGGMQRSPVGAHSGAEVDIPEQQVLPPASRHKLSPVHGYVRARSRNSWVCRTRKRATGIVIRSKKSMSKGIARFFDFFSCGGG